MRGKTTDTDAESDTGILPTKYIPNTEKVTFLYVTLPDYHATDHHFLVPRVSENGEHLVGDGQQAGGVGLRVEPVLRRPGRDPGVNQVRWQPQQPQQPQQQPGAPCGGEEEGDDRAVRDLPALLTRADDSYNSAADRHTDVVPAAPTASTASTRGADGSRFLQTYRGRETAAIDLVRFDSAMLPVNYTEAVTVRAQPPRRQTSCASFCDVTTQPRFKTSVQIDPRLTPVGFQSRIVCFRDCSKKRFKSTVDYIPKMAPRGYEETQYVRPKTKVMTYVTYLDYKALDSRQWFTTSVDLVPKTHSHNSVHNFQLRGDLVTSEDEEEPVEGRDAHPAAEDDTAYPGDVKMGWRYKQSAKVKATANYTSPREVGDINMNFKLNGEVSDPDMTSSMGTDFLDMDHGGVFELRRKVETVRDTSEPHQSHRSKVVVRNPLAMGGRRAEEDHVAYMNGYNSTQNGFFSGEDTLNM